MALRARDMAALAAKHAPKPKPKPAAPGPSPAALVKARLGFEGLGRAARQATEAAAKLAPALPPRPRRLTRQERAKVRAFWRLCLRRNPHRGMTYGDRQAIKEGRRRSLQAIAKEGVEALVFYVQDEGHGAIAVTQVLREMRALREAA